MKICLLIILCSVLAMTSLCATEGSGIRCMTLDLAGRYQFKTTEPDQASHSIRVHLTSHFKMTDVRVYRISAQHDYSVLGAFFRKFQFMITAQKGDGCHIIFSDNEDSFLADVLDFGPIRGVNDNGDILLKNDEAGGQAVFIRQMASW